MRKITDCYGDERLGWHALLSAAHTEIQALDPDYSVWSMPGGGRAESCTCSI
jgi:hypothetical protein